MTRAIEPTEPLNHEENSPTLRLHERRAVAASISRKRGIVEYSPAYSGGYLHTEDYGEYPTVIDLESCTLEQDIPILVEHDHRCDDDIAGTITEIRLEGNRIIAKGKLGNTSAARRVLRGDETFRWKPSIGAKYRFHDRRRQEEFVPEGVTIRVNGRDLEGPFTLARNTYVSEISMVAIPGDPDAVAVLASRTHGGDRMSFDEFLTSKEMSQETFNGLSPSEQDTLRKEWETLSAGDPGVSASGVSASGDDAAAVQEMMDAGENLQDTLDELASGDVTPEQAAPLIAESARAIEDIAESVAEETLPSSEAVQAEGRTALKAALKTAAERAFRQGAASGSSAGSSSGSNASAVRASANHASANHGGITPQQRRSADAASQRWRAVQASMTPSLARSGGGSSAHGAPTANQIMLAQYASSAGLPDRSMKFLFLPRGTARTPQAIAAAERTAERAVNAAIDSGRYGAGRVCTRELIDRSLMTHRQNPTSYSDNSKMVIDRWRDLYSRVAVRASMSTFDAMDAINVVVQAFVMDALQEAEPTYKQITREQVVRDFGETKMVRINLLGRLRELSETGKLPQLTTSSEKKTLSILNNGGAVTVSLMDLVNDTLNLFADIGSQCVTLAEGCIEADVYDTFGGLIAGLISAQDEQTFFSAARGNLLKGAEYALSAGVPALSAANRLFKKFRSPNQGYLANTGAIMLTGTANYDYAMQIYESQGITALSERGDKNIFFNRYLPIDTPYLDSDEYGSDTLWFMLADPAKRPFLVVTKMAGYESPVVKQVQRPIWDEESIGYTIDYPYGINVMNPDGIVMVTGEA